MLHVSYSANPAPTSAVRPRDSAHAGQDASAPPSSRGSDLRKACRRAASLLVRRAAALAPLAAMARALGVGASRAEDYADPEHDAAIALGDVMALPTSAAVAILEGALADVRERAGAKLVHLPAEVRVGQAARAGAKVSHEALEALADGQVDAGERARLLRCAREARAQLDMVIADLGGDQ